MCFFGISLSFIFNVIDFSYYRLKTRQDATLFALVPLKFMLYCAYINFAHMPGKLNSSSTLSYSWFNSTMASSESIEIHYASPQESPSAASVTETTPLVKKSEVKRSGLLRRLRESVLIKSKAANMILFWSTLAYLVYGSLLNPENCFVPPIRQLYAFQTNDPNSVIIKLTNSTSGIITFLNMMGSVVYGLIGVWLLFYPLAGYLADVRYGRYKVVTFGLKIIWLGILTFVTIFIILYAMACALNGNVWIITDFYNGLDRDNIALVGCGVSLTGLILACFIIVSVGFAAFAANVIQFGIDQLQDLPAKSSFLFIHWHLLVIYFGVSIGKLIWNTSAMTITLSKHPLFQVAIGLLLSVLVLLVVIFGMPISFCIAKRKWFIIDSGIGNPYREVVRVVGFAKRHKVPIQRSAFTYWEDDIPTGLDLGKNKYGGPFTTEQVENVKAFFGILYIFIALGPIFTAEIAASAFLPILKYHVDNWYPGGDNYNAYTVFTNGGTFYPFFIIILIPVFLKIIDPLFQRYIPTILKRIGIGLCLITMSLLCSLLVDTIGHALPSGQNATSMFNPGHIILKETNYYKITPLQVTG